MKYAIVCSLILLAMLGGSASSSNTLEQTNTYSFNWTPLICAAAPFGILITALGGLVEYLWIKFAELVWNINFENGDMTGFKVYGVAIGVADLLVGILSFWGVFHCTTQLIQVSTS